MTLDEIKDECRRLSPWAHVATVRPDGQPDVVPVHPCWEGDVLWFMAGETSVKARNIAAGNARVALHWQVDPSGDGVELWGTAETFTDLDTKRRLWNGVFDYDLNAFAPGGPERSPGTAFIAVRPDRILVIKAYGTGGRSVWTKEA